jgi:hypothetical protein
MSLNWFMAGKGSASERGEFSRSLPRPAPPHGRALRFALSRGRERRPILPSDLFVLKLEIPKASLFRNVRTDPASRQNSGHRRVLLASGGEGRSARSAGEEPLAGRSQWITLLCEVLPRASWRSSASARILLGSSGGGQFLLVLPGEARTAAENFLSAAAAHIGELSSGHVSLIWAATENLGDWAVVRKRLNEQLQSRRNAPLAASARPPSSPRRPSRRTRPNSISPGTAAARKLPPLRSPTGRA